MDSVFITPVEKLGKRAVFIAVEVIVELRGGDVADDDLCDIVASADRVLIWTASGDLLLLDSAADEYRLLSYLRPFEEKNPDSLARPAFAGDRICLRSSKELVCF